MHSTSRIQPGESRICGEWALQDGRRLVDAATRRICELIKHELVEAGRSEDGWTILYPDRNDGRYWELSYPNSDQHGGGPPCLESLSRDVAVAKYQLAVD